MRSVTTPANTALASHVQLRKSRTGQARFDVGGETNATDIRNENPSRKAATPLKAPAWIQNCRVPIRLPAPELTNSLQNCTVAP